MNKIPIKDLMPSLNGVLMWSIQKKRALEAIFGTQV